MKKLFSILLAAFVMMSITSCKKWLDVKPEDKFIEEQIFSTPQGFADALNGLYIKTGSSDMYGGDLTMTTMDVLGQLYLVSSSNSAQYAMSTYSYADPVAKAKVDKIWSNAYNGIININQFLSSLNTYGSVLNPNTAKMYKGETLALRAFYYFDLMRMFTKPYTTADSLSKVLPYYETPTYKASEYMPSTYIMKRILQDLNEAEELLQQTDPAVSASRVSKSTRDFSRNSRTYKMNFYAVKALKARVNLWKGNKTEALKNAKYLIDQQSKFPWVELSDLNTVVCNRIFATEMIFGVENPKLADVYNANFNPGLSDGLILAPNTTGTFINTTVFEGYANDYRNQFIWKTEGRPYPTFFKYKDGDNSSFNIYRTVPLLRMAEMYLIAAECEPNTTTATGYLNNLRMHRNISDIPSGTTDLNPYILKEYRKEFYGEGQLFFYYKRTQASSITAGGSNVALNMTPSNYTFPIPDSETSAR